MSSRRKHFTKYYYKNCRLTALFHYYLCCHFSGRMEIKMKKIKIVQIGVGHDHALPTWISLLKQSDLFDVVGWCPVADEAERPIDQRYFQKPRMTLDEVFAVPDLDAVAIETDDWNLTEYAQAAAEHGLAIQMDKPGSASQEDFEKLARTVKAKGGVLHLGYMYRYNPMIKSVIAAAKVGEYGDICSVETHMDCEHPVQKRQWLAHFKGGMLYYLGCHLIDLIVQINGIPEKIIPLSYSSGYDGVTSEDVGMAVFQYPNCVSFAKTSGVESGGFLRRQMVITGKKRSVEIRPMEEIVSGSLQITRMRDCVAGRSWNDEGVHSATKPTDRYDGMLAQFAAIARGEIDNSYSLEYECQLHRVILAACGYEIDYKTPVVL